jgi:hypothetical protein
MIKDIGVEKDLERSDGNLSHGLFLQLTAPPGRKKITRKTLFFSSNQVGRFTENGQPFLYIILY